MMFRLSPLVSEAKPSADSIPAWRSTSSSIPLPSTISPVKSLPSRSKARRLLSMTVTWWPALERARAAMAPTRPQPTMTSFIELKPHSKVLPAERQPSGLYLRQPGLADLRLGGGDVVRNSPKSDRRRGQVDDGVRRLRVAVSWLADASGIDEGGGGQRDPFIRFGDLLTLCREDPGEVRVPEEAEARAEPHQDLECLEIIENVLPEVGLARAAVHVTVRTQPPELGQARQVAPALGREDSLGPAGGSGRGRT